MRLKKLLKNLAVSAKGSRDIEVTGITANSKTVAPGNLFVVKKGTTTDGTKYIPEALAAGASAVLVDMFDPSLTAVTQLVCDDVPAVEAMVAAEYFDHPSAQLFTVGVTGTNGKTTTTFLVKHLLEAALQENSCGLIGTIEYIVGNHRYIAERTSPDVITMQKLLREMVQQGCQSAAIEVSSHGLQQERVKNVQFDVAVFTNLSLDHLDYHGTMEQYCAAKNRLFTMIEPGNQHAAIINGDDPWAQKVSQGCRVPIITYGFGDSVDIRASQMVLMPDKTAFTVEYQGQQRNMAWAGIGKFNVYNALAAIGVGLVKGLTLQQIQDGLACAPQVSGRLQTVANTLDIAVYVDYAHTPDALENVLQTLQTICQRGRVITIFGCGGDRDRSKRPVMASVAEKNSDVCIVTSDNPRSEDPQAICNDIVKGFSKDAYHVEVDRKKAIALAITLADKGDAVLIAGKGHETSQTFAHQTVEFDDRKVAADICRQHEQQRSVAPKG